MTRTIIVKPGDTLTGIARREDVALNDLKEANPGLCRQSEGPRRDEGCNWIYPGDEVSIPESRPEAGPRAMAERAWRGVAGALSRAGRFLSERLGASPPAAAGRAPVVIDPLRIFNYKTPEALFRGFTDGTITPDATVTLGTGSSLRMGPARDIVKAELKHRGVYRSQFGDDYWLGVYALSELAHPTPAKAARAAAAPAREPAARRERTDQSRVAASGPLTINVDLSVIE